MAQKSERVTYSQESIESWVKHISREMRMPPHWHSMASFMEMSAREASRTHRTAWARLFTSMGRPMREFAREHDAEYFAHKPEEQKFQECYAGECQHPREIASATLTIDVCTELLAYERGRGMLPEVLPTAMVVKDRGAIGVLPMLLLFSGHKKIGNH